MSQCKLPSYPFGAKKVCFLLVFCCIWFFNLEAQSIEGIWTEHWLDSDVDYVDTLQFQFKENQWEIELVNSTESWNPQFVNETFDGSFLKFQVNVNNVTNFFVFQRVDDPNQLIGKVFTWKGEIKRVYLLRQD